ncbi:hypothetical protein M409DRAFT_65293 [Zasmidium cellare ATCC 36951]|uniref:HypA-like protein n=1 Tax=Zasmidium cellare ATCC 36951 TaxID=1080233 RepID=A0A6A6CPB8_ZASCE|nr:uncharacterized protein M409DRAFT_65293 [Zasmidium cellare ATCC 36951]KAF2168955.1 hypothetical protein M409DRAFT_65293 [Zasmidium cellare ATCC 36951]
MATAGVVQLRSDQKPEYYRPDISPESTRTASELLQINHERYHIFFNASGFHNHIVHQLLSMWALGASSDQLQREYDHNASYQRPLKSASASILRDLGDPSKFMGYFGQQRYYGDYLQFFKEEIEKTSWQDVLHKYVFAGDERAEQMLLRMFAGLLHPIIHLGFGVEFEQPAIIAEALAQAACHNNSMGDFLLSSEKAAQEQPQTPKPIVQLLDEIHADQTSNTPKPIQHYASQIHISPSELSAKTAEMTNAVIYYTGAAQRPTRAIKFDFVFIHCVNSTIFFPCLLRLPFLTPSAKTRLLEWKIRLDLNFYASPKAPTLRHEDIRNYQPKIPSGWEGVQERVLRLPDDGHAVKLVRAIAHGERVCKGFEGREGFRIRGEEWLKLGHMVVDSCEGKGTGSGMYWVRSAGLDGAWEGVEVRGKL